MGVNDYGSAAQTTAAPSLAAWAEDVAAALDGSDVTVDTRIATHNADTTAVHGIANTAALETVGHAAKHASGGSDPVTLAQSQVTNLTTDLALKAPLASPTFTGTVTIPTPAAGSETTVAASTAWAADRARVGNLLTANQASVETDTTGWSSGSATVGRSTALAYVGSASLTATASGAGAGLTVSTGSGTGIPCTSGAVYTFQAMARCAAGMGSRSAQIGVSWRNSGGAEAATSIASPVTVSDSGWTLLTHTAVAPAGTVGFSLRPQFTATGGGDVMHYDALGLWAGAGGDWAMPGVPIVNLGHRVTHPNTDDVLVQKWDAGLGRWQTVHYDSGWRDVTTAVAAAWSDASGVVAAIRRIGSDIHFRCDVTLGAGLTQTAYWAPPTGFAAPGTIGGTVGDGIARGQSSAATAWVLARATFGLRVFGASTAAAAYRASFQYTTADAIPTSLPGVLVSAAPA